MRRSETEIRSDSGQAVPSGIDTGSRALAVIETGTASDGAERPRFVRPRAHAGFLAQLIVSADPALRPSRGERTRAAAQHYAATARTTAPKRVA